MKVIILALLVAAAQAAPSIHDDAVDLESTMKYMPVLDDAPVYPSPRIVNGQPATRGLLPYQAALLSNNRLFCGASLISPSWVITAAHCTVNTQQVTVSLGALRLNVNENDRQNILSRNIINHANYNPSNLNNDLSLIFLPTAARLSSVIEVVALPSLSQRGYSFVGYNSRASGWGRTNDIPNSPASTQLNFVDVSIISNAQCAQTYGNQVIVPGTICAAAVGGRSTCNGDSGGPLVTLGNNPTLIGVVSFVSRAGCGSGNPSGYVRVTEYLGWINSNTGIPIRT